MAKRFVLRIIIDAKTAQLELKDVKMVKDGSKL